MSETRKQTGTTELLAQSQSCRDVAAERYRQLYEEGWTPKHDDAHTDRAIAKAAACYALAAAGTDTNYLPALWPWDSGWWKPRGARENLVRAAALILAEIDRIDRVAKRAEPGKSSHA